MDNDSPRATDSCIGLSTASRHHPHGNSLRPRRLPRAFYVTSKSSGGTRVSLHASTMAGAANRCVIHEHKFQYRAFTRNPRRDRAARIPARYSIVMVSKEQYSKAANEMVFESERTDAYVTKARRSDEPEIVGVQNKDPMLIQQRQENRRLHASSTREARATLYAADVRCHDSIAPMDCNLALDLC